MLLEWPCMVYKYQKRKNHFKNILQKMASSILKRLARLAEFCTISCGQITIAVN